MLSKPCSSAELQAGWAAPSIRWGSVPVSHSASPPPASEGRQCAGDGPGWALKVVGAPLRPWGSGHGADEEVSGPSRGPAARRGGHVCSPDADSDCAWRARLGILPLSVSMGDWLGR